MLPFPSVCVRRLVKKAPIRAPVKWTLMFTYKNIQKTLFYPRLKVSLSEWSSGHLRLCLKPKTVTCTIRAAIFWLCTSLHHHQPQIHAHPLPQESLSCFQHTTYPTSLPQPWAHSVSLPKRLHSSHFSFPAQICCHVLREGLLREIRTSAYLPPITLTTVFLSLLITIVA